MKKIILLVLICFFAAGCPAPRGTENSAPAKGFGEVVSPPEGMEDAVKNHLSDRDMVFRGMNVRAYPKDVYIVAVDAEDPQANKKYEKNRVWRLIAQKAQNAGKSYWQIKAASIDEIKKIEDLKY